MKALLGRLYSEAERVEVRGWTMESYSILGAKWHEWACRLSDGFNKAGVTYDEVALLLGDGVQCDDRRAGDLGRFMRDLIMMG